MRPVFSRLLGSAVLAIGAACVDVPLDLVRPRVGSVTLISAATQVTQVSSEAVNPQLRVLGPDSLPLRGIEVRFATPNEGASVTPAIVRTDSLGIAQPFAWTVSGTPGTDTLVATVVGVGAYRFLATVTPPCVGTTPALVGDSINGAVTTSGCLTGGGRRATAYLLTNPAPTLPYSVVMRMTGTGYRGRIDLQRNGLPIASSVFDTSTTPATRSGLSVFLPPGGVTLLAQSETPASTGAFGLQTSGAVIYVGCANNVFLVPGASSTQSIDDTGCQFRDANGSTYYAHRYRIRMAAGQRIVARMSSTTLSCFMLLLDPSGENILVQENFGTTAASTLAFVAPSTGYYVLATLSASAPRAVGGPYTVSVDP